MMQEAIDLRGRMQRSYSEAVKKKKKENVNY